MKLLLSSIRGRMLALSAIATFVALVVAGFVIVAVLGRIVTQGVDRRLDAQIALLATAVGSDGRIEDSRLAVVKGALEAGPGWRWRIVTPDRTIGSRDFPDLDPAPTGRRDNRRGEDGGPYPRDGRDVDRISVHAREVSVSTTGGAVVLSASAPREVIERPVREALVPLLVLLAVLAVVLTGAAFGQVWFGMRPLRELRGEIASIRAGRSTELRGNQPAELRPLVDELNALASDNRDALEAARTSASNLAHALKTPVATLALELRDAPDQARHIARIEATIRHHLSRARGRITDRRARTSVATATAALVTAVSRLNVDRQISITIDIHATVAVAVEPTDFDEIVGNLLDNAVRHARSTVAISALTEERLVRVSIEDDGPGIKPDDLIRAEQPGVRLDERGAGHGFGLAITLELAELYGGRLRLDISPAGGLLAVVELPIASL